MSRRSLRKTRPAETSIKSPAAPVELPARTTPSEKLPLLLVMSDSQAALSAPDAFVDESQRFHFFRIKQIPPVEHDGMRQCFARPFQIQFLERRPFRGDHQRVTA